VSGPNERSRGSRESESSRTARCCPCGTRLSITNPGTRCGVCERKRAATTVHPPILNRDFWNTDRYRQAFEPRDIGEVFWVYRTDPRHREIFGDEGITQTLLGSWIGLSQGQISRIEKGRQKGQSLDTLIEWSQKLGFPSDLLWFDLPGMRRGAGLGGPQESGNSAETSEGCARVRKKGNAPLVADSRNEDFANARMRAGYTQEEFSYKVGVDRSTIERWELGIQKPQSWQRSKVANALGLTMSELAKVIDSPKGLIGPTSDRFEDLLIRADLPYG
jgi:transcriptional regulator with XRE-family HTH domain